MGTAESGTGAGLRANLPRGSMLLLNRPGGMKPLERTKMYYPNGTDILYLRG